MSKNSPRQNANQFKEWLSWLISTTKKRKY